MKECVEEVETTSSWGADNDSHYGDSGNSPAAGHFSAEINTVSPRRRLVDSGGGRIGRGDGRTGFHGPIGGTVLPSRCCPQWSVAAV